MYSLQYSLHLRIHGLVLLLRSVPSLVGLFVSSVPKVTLAAPLPCSGGSTLVSSPNRLTTTSSSLSTLLLGLSGTVLSVDLAALACVVRLALLLVLARFGDG